jgi:MFS superfamily sulfate permease-like transporter
LISLFTSFNAILSVTAIDEMKGTDSNTNYDLRVHGIFNALMGILGFLTGSGTLPRLQAIINFGAVIRAANVGTGYFFFVLLAILAPVVADLPLWATSGMLVATSLQ